VDFDWNSTKFDTEGNDFEESHIEREIVSYEISEDQFYKNLGLMCGFFGMFSFCYWLIDFQ
jgi:hypothetical protein